MNTERSTSGSPVELAVPVEVLDRLQPSMYSRMMQSSPSTLLEVEDAADVLVVEHRVSPRLFDEERDVARVLGVAQLLHDDRALEARLPDEQALVDLAHAPGAELLEDLVLLQHGHEC